MRKIIFLISMILLLTTFSGIALASGSATFSDLENEPQIETTLENNEENVTNNSNKTEETTNTKDDEKLDGASEEIIGAVSKKDKKIAELSDKYNDRFLGTVAYYLDVVRYYSTPIFFIFLTIGAFNFFIIGNKKLDKKEQGFGWITACIIGWVVFQCIPLIFSLFAI